MKNRREKRKRAEGRTGVRRGGKGRRQEKEDRSLY